MSELYRTGWIAQVLTVSQGEAEFKTKLSLVTAVIPLPDGQGYESQPLYVQLKEVKHSKEKLYGGLTVDLAHFRTSLPAPRHEGGNFRSVSMVHSHEVPGVSEGPLTV